MASQTQFNCYPELGLQAGSKSASSVSLLNLILISWIDGVSSRILSFKGVSIAKT